MVTRAAKAGDLSLRKTQAEGGLACYARAAKRQKE